MSKFGTEEGGLEDKIALGHRLIFVAANSENQELASKSFESKSSYF